MKRYFWLKLKEDFFDERYIKALRRLPSGDSLAIVYLKMQLKSLKTEGIIKYEGLLPDSVAELAMALDEDDNIVRLAVEALIRFGVIERWDDETIYMSAMQNLIGSESDSAERVRKHRALQKEAFKLPSNGDMLHCNEQVTACNTEKEREKDSDKEKNKSSSKMPSEHALVKPQGVSDELFGDWVAYKKTTLKPRMKVSQRMVDGLVREANKAGISIEEAMNFHMESGYVGFKAEYVKKESGDLFGQQPKEATADTITESQVSFFANKLAYYDPMSKFSRSGESYQQFEKRLATNLRIPEHFEKYKPYLVQMGLLKG